MFVICYICNKQSDEWYQKFAHRRLKCSKLTISDIIKRLIGNVSVHRGVDDISNCICLECLKNIEEYNSMFEKLKQTEKRLRDLILKTDKERNADGGITNKNASDSELDDLASSEVTSETDQDITHILVKTEDCDDGDIFTDEIKIENDEIKIETDEINEGISNNEIIIADITSLANEESHKIIESNISTETGEDELMDFLNDPAENSNSKESIESKNAPKNTSNTQKRPRKKPTKEKPSKFGDFQCELCDINFHERKLFEVIHKLQ